MHKTHLFQSLLCLGIEITAHPDNATVYVGESVYFRCEYTGTPALPYWEINGNRHSSSTLPSEYHSTVEGLYLNAAQLSMNNTKYACVFTPYIGGGQFGHIQSHPAYLIVRNFGELMCMYSERTLNRYIMYN